MIQAPDQLTREHLAADRALFERVLVGDGPLELDMSRVRDLDSAGAAWLSLLQRRAAANHRELRLHGLSPELERLLSMFPALDAPDPPPDRAAPFFAALGGRALELWEVLAGFTLLCADAVWFTVATLLGHYRLRARAVVYEMSAMGSRALGVVGLIAFLVGATMGLQSAAQLRRFGADIFVVDLTVISMLRELGPLMAAIVVAGRSGAAVAAELGTMTVTEEVDALRTMGLHPTRFLVVPKIMAISLVQPLLTAYADALGVLGGFLVAIAYLDVGPSAFLARLVEILTLKDVLTGLCKSVVFAWLIVSVGAWYGLHTRGGADAVGRSTTASVVTGIFAVVVADAAASMLFYFGG